MPSSGQQGNRQSMSGVMMGRQDGRRQSLCLRIGCTTVAKRVDFGMALGSIVLAALVGPLYGSPYMRPFFEADDAYSYPKVAHETVPFTALCVYAVAIPFALAIAIPLIVRKHVGFDKPVRPVTDAWLSVTTLVTAGGITGFTTTFIKYYAGRLRPNFFALCEYPFNNVTNTYGTPHQFGSFSSCAADTRVVYHAQTSFPSGHSSWSFCGLGFIGILLWYTASSGPARMPRWAPTLFGALPFFFASLIATSRTRDNYHHFSDVLCGSCLGAAITLAVFWTNYPKPTPRTGKEKREDPTLRDPMLASQRAGDV